MTTISTPLMALMNWSELPSTHTWQRFLLLTHASRDPEIQEKVRRVVTQGHIDPEDFNGVSVDN